MNINEIKLDNLADFYSMADLHSAIRRTMKVFCWGAHAWTKMNEKMLRFKVEAHRHKGHVYIAVQGNDLFIVYLTNIDGTIKKTFTDVYIDSLIDTIDTEIEYIPAYGRN